MNTIIQTWYNFVLQQMAAESYLDGWEATGTTDRQNRLQLGCVLNYANQTKTQAR